MPPMATCPPWLSRRPTQSVPDLAALRIPGTTRRPGRAKHDEIVDEELSDLFRLRSGSRLYGAVVVARTGGRLSFTGHIESAHRRADIDRLWVTGRRFRARSELAPRDTTTAGPVRPEHSRLRRGNPKSPWRPARRRHRRLAAPDRQLSSNSSASVCATYTC